MLTFLYLVLPQRPLHRSSSSLAMPNVVGNYLTHEVESKIELTKGEEVTLKGSTMSSSPIAAVFGGTALTDEDPIVKSFVTSPSQFMTIMGTMDSAVGYEICVGMQLAAG